MRSTSWHGDHRSPSSPRRRRCCSPRIGELVAERSGVLNLGVEGMMIIGAVAGFIASVRDSGYPVARHPRRDRSPACCLATLFAFVTLVLVANQVATGLALTLFGLGLAGADRRVLRQHAGRSSSPPIHIPGPHRPAVRRPDRLRPGSAGLSRGRADHRRLVVPVPHARRARSCAPSATITSRPMRSATAWSRVRFLAVLFGGACAGLAAPICRWSTPRSGSTT